MKTNKTKKSSHKNRCDKNIFSFWLCCWISRYIS